MESDGGIKMAFLLPYFLVISDILAFSFFFAFPFVLPYFLVVSDILAFSFFLLHSFLLFRFSV